MGKNDVMLPDYLYMTAEQVEAENELAEAWAEDPGICDGQMMIWSDYNDETKPTELQARSLCSGCPVFTQCQTFARVLKPTHGVWAGKVYGSRKKEVS